MKLVTEVVTERPSAYAQVVRTMDEVSDIDVITGAAGRRSLSELFWGSRRRAAARQAVLEQLIDSGVLFVPAHNRYQVNEWADQVTSVRGAHFEEYTPLVYS